MLATVLVRMDYYDDMRERFRVITAVPRPVSGLCKGAFWALAVTIVVLSYSFVLQPAFDPPVEDIYTNNSVEEFSTDGGYILERKDGSYSLVLSNGTIYDNLNQIALEMCFDEGLEIRKE